MAHKFWRIYITGTTGGYVGVYSLDFQDANGNSLCNGGNPIASSAYAYYAPNRAFPGGATNWISNGEGGGAWIGYQFAAPVDVAKVALAGVGPCGDRPSQPTTAVLQSSDDGGVWSNEYETDEPAGGWPYAQAVVYNAPPPPPPSPAVTNQFAAVVVASPQLGPSAGATSSQVAVVMPMHDIPIPSGGAFTNQFVVVTVGYEYKPAKRNVPMAIRALWGFPLLIQKGNR